MIDANRTQQFTHSTQPTGTYSWLSLPAQLTQGVATSTRVISTRTEQRARPFQQTKDTLMSKVVVVVDDVESSSLISEILKGAGHSVNTLRTSAEIFRVLSQYVPDVVIIEMNTPSVSNLLTLTFIRRLTELSHTKIIMITAHAQIAKSLWRAEVVLDKPVSNELLLEAVSRYL